jgi:MYXO-CTERM domain-containing protein
MTAATDALRFASAVALALVLSGPGLAMDGSTSRGLAPAAPSLASDATRQVALPIVCAPRQGSPAGAAAGFGLAIAGAAALSRRRPDRLR